MTEIVPAELRLAYLRQIAKAIAADGRIDDEEILRLYQVFALLDTADGERMELLETLVFRPEDLSEETVPAEIVGNDSLRNALAKDALFISEVQGDTATRGVVDRMLGQLELSGAQVRVIKDWIRLENRMLKKLGAGGEWMESEGDVREIASRAAAVGIPLGALYMAGITGFSAVGLTSGLATIGAYTGLAVLGLNPMTAGIAGLIIAGVTVKKLSRFALKSSRTDLKELAGRSKEMQFIQLKSATRLSGDIPRLEARWSAATDAHTSEVLLEMKSALKRSEALQG